LSLEVQRESLLQDIANTTLLSPISGVVVTKEPERLIGKYTARGSAVLDIEHVGEFKAKILVKERDVAEIKVGQPVRLKVYGYPSKEFYGEVRHISSTVEIETIGSLTTPAITVEASIGDPEHVLKTGMNGIARIKSERKTYFDLALRKLVHWFKIEFWM
jgi:multidrug efflux pump subunit AcrA (membrane-fusion protein)